MFGVMVATTAVTASTSFFKHVTVAVAGISGLGPSLVAAVQTEEVGAWVLGVGGFSGLAIWGALRAIQDYRGREMEQDGHDRTLRHYEDALHAQQAVTRAESEWNRLLINALIQAGVSIPPRPVEIQIEPEPTDEDDE